MSITNGLLIGQTERAERFYANGNPLISGNAAAGVGAGAGAGSPNASAEYPDQGVIQQWLADMHAWRANVGRTVMDNRTRLGSMAYWHACMMGYYRVIEKRSRGDAEVQLCAVSVLDAVVEAGEKVEFILWVRLPSLKRSLGVGERFRSAVSQRGQEGLRTAIGCGAEIEAPGVRGGYEDAWGLVPSGGSETFVAGRLFGAEVWESQAAEDVRGGTSISAGKRSAFECHQQATGCIAQAGRVLYL